MAPQCLLRGAFLGLSAVSALCSDARAQGAETAAQGEVAIDYNAPKSERTLLDYGRAAANVSAANWAIWQIAWLSNKDWAPVTRQTLEANLDAGFTFDQDVFQTNFFGHPYHGGLQFNGARATGLSFWESTLYVLMGSLSWELFAEREKPSLNDLAATTLGLRHAYINQPIEVARLRPELATLVGAPGMRPDLMLRFGYGPLLPYSPRRPVASVLV